MKDARTRFTQAAAALVAAVALAAATPAFAGQLQILVNTGTAPVNQPDVTWNNLTTASGSTPLFYSDGSLSGLAFANITGVAPINDTRLTPAATLAGHPLSWISSLSEANRAAFSTNFSQNAFNPPMPTNVNMTGMSGLAGRDITVEVVATYMGSNPSEVRTGDYFVNGQLTTADGGATPTYKPSDNYQNGGNNLNYMLWQDLPWGSGPHSGDTLSVSWQRENNTVVLNGYSVNYELPGIVADFTGGNGNTSADQFGGKAGDGWKGGWNGVGTGTGTVSTADPVNNGGAYLSATGVNAAGGAGFTRQFGSFLNLDPASTFYRVEADFRVDSDSATNFQIGVRASNAVNTGGDVLGWIRANSSTFDVFNGNGAGGAATVNTGLAAIAGDTYHVEFLINPLNKTYRLLLDNLDDELGAYISGILNLRNTGTVSMPYLFVGSQASGQATAFSLDNVLIVAVPTPAALPAGLALLGLAMVRRSTRLTTSRSTRLTASRRA